MTLNGVNIIEYGEKGASRICAALGFFDCIHIGHRAIIEKAVEMAESLNAIPALFTFSNNPFLLLGNGKSPVYTFEERLYELYEMGVKTVVRADFDKAFMNMSGQAFFDGLVNTGVVGIACGKDYTCGVKGKTDVNALSQMAENKSIAIQAVDDVLLYGERVSSTRIRNALSEGNVKGASELLGKRYMIASEVIKGDGLGKTFGFPTANLIVDGDKQLPKNGVYSGVTEIDGVKYGVAVHIGRRPTVNKEELRVEAFIKGFDGDLYGKRLRIELTDRIRDIIKFESVEQLSEQISRDVEKAALSESAIE